MARKLRYQVATSLDGFIAGPRGEFDWIPRDPDIDFAAMFAQFDALLMGRGTWELVVGKQGGGPVFGKVTYVVSTTLDPEALPGVHVIASDVERRVRELKAEPGKDIWLFGGGRLFASLLEAGLVDSIELAYVPVLVGGGIPLLAPVPSRHALALTGHRVYPRSGIVVLTYDSSSRA